MQHTGTVALVVLLALLSMLSFNMLLQLHKRIIKLEYSTAEALNVQRIK